MGYRQVVRPRILTPVPLVRIQLPQLFGCVAQVVEHLTFNQVVRGSNPRTLIIDSIYIDGVSPSGKAQDSDSCTAGSNPATPVIWVCSSGGRALDF